MPVGWVPLALVAWARFNSDPMKNLFGLRANRPYLVRESGSTTHHEVTVTRANAESARLVFRDGTMVDLTTQSDVEVVRDTIVFH